MMVTVYLKFYPMEIGLKLPLLIKVPVARSRSKALRLSMQTGFGGAIQPDMQKRKRKSNYAAGQL